MDQQEEQPLPLPSLESLPPLVWLAALYLSAFAGWGGTAIAAIGMSNPPDTVVSGGLVSVGLTVTLLTILATASSGQDDPPEPLILVVVLGWSALVSSAVTIVAFNILTAPFIDYAVLILTLGLLPALNIAAASAHFLYKWARQHQPGWFRVEPNTNQQTSELAS